MKRGKSNQDKKRKEQKKLQKMYKEEDSFFGKWFIVFCVVIVFLMFYILTVYITNKNADKKNNTDTESKTATGEILLGRSFSMNDGEYFVLYYDTSDEETASTYQELFSSYRSANGDSSIYYVDLNSGFSKSHVTTEESNKNPKTVGDLFINGSTLIKISQNKLVEYVEGLDAIREHLS